MATAALILLTVLLFGALPIWPFNKEWDFKPFVTIAIIFLIVFSLVLMTYPATIWRAI